MISKEINTLLGQDFFDVFRRCVDYEDVDDANYLGILWNYCYGPDNKLNNVKEINKNKFKELYLKLSNKYKVYCDSAEAIIN